jgi:uncharacterized protein YwgA
MKAYDFVHLVLEAAGGEIQGRTKLQKMVYFAGVLTGSLEHLGYRAHFYGPYSSSVTAAVEDLRSLGFLEQRISGAGTFDPHGFEVARYDYKLTEDGRRIAQDKAHTRPHAWAKIKQAVTRLEKADVTDYIKLSIAAKAFFLRDSAHQPLSLQGLVQMSQEFGWKVSQDQVAEATHWLESLQLLEGDAN